MGHAVVMRAFDVPVQAISVIYTEEKGWHGDTFSGVDPNALPLPDQFVILTAGKMAEELFECRAHSRTWMRDYGEIESRLDREGLAHQREQHIAEAEARARATLSNQRANALRLFDWLVEHGRIEREAFERLMQGYT
jgi:hypothetical protein